MLGGTVWKKPWTWFFLLKVRVCTYLVAINHKGKVCQQGWYNLLLNDKSQFFLVVLTKKEGVNKYSF